MIQLWNSLPLVSYINLRSVCLSVCLLLLQKVLLGNTPQYLSQMKSDLHEILSILQNWSPELIIIICARARARAHMHAQQVEPCTQLWAKNKPSYFMWMKSDLYETWYDVRGDIKEAPKKIWDRYMHARTCIARKRACMFLYLVIVFKRCRFGGEEENESWSEASVSVRARTAAIDVKRAIVLDLISQATDIWTNEI